MTYTGKDYENAIDVIRSRTDQQPAIGLVLGSGLGSLADEISEATVIPYSDIPGWPQSTVHGHGGNLVIGTLEGQTVIAQQGRAHYYEGYAMQQVTFPIRVMHFMGASTVILTNAAGGLNPSYTPGDLMLINDHINLPGIAGINPLIGPNDDSIGPRFPGMTHTYDRDLRGLATKVAQDNNIALHEGVYIGLSGPFFETPAEVRMLRGWGADAVGMSTVQEVLVAIHAGMRVMACSGITNASVDTIESADVANHEEVLEIGKVIVPKLTRLLRGVLKALPV